MKRTTVLLAAVASAGVLLLAGCGASSESPAASNVDSGGGPARAVAPESGPGSATEGGARSGAEPAGGDTGGNPLKPPAQAGGPPQGRHVIYTANLRIRSDDIERASTRAKRFVAEAGGHIAHENAQSEPGEPATVAITFKIPAERYPATLDRLSKELGTRLSLSQESDDVTEQVADVESRVKSAEEAIASYRRLLDRADDIEEILSIEREISTRVSDLESLKARQRALSEQTAYATVRLNLESGTADSSAPRDGGFRVGLRNGWEAFLSVLNITVTVIGWLLPFLGAAAILAYPVRLLWRFARRRMGPRSAPVAAGRGPGVWGPGGRDARSRDVRSPAGQGLPGRSPAGRGSGGDEPHGGAGGVGDTGPAAGSGGEGGTSGAASAPTESAGGQSPPMPM